MATQHLTTLICMTTQSRVGAKQQKTKKIEQKNLELSSPKIVQGKNLPASVFFFFFLPVVGKT